MASSVVFGSLKRRTCSTAHRNTYNVLMRCCEGEREMCVTKKASLPKMFFRFKSFGSTEPETMTKGSISLVSYSHAAAAAEPHPPCHPMSTDGPIPKPGPPPPPPLRTSNTTRIMRTYYLHSLVFFKQHWACTTTDREPSHPAPPGPLRLASCERHPPSHRCRCNSC